MTLMLRRCLVTKLFYGCASITHMAQKNPEYYTAPTSLTSCRYSKFYQMAVVTVNTVGVVVVAVGVVVCVWVCVLESGWGWGNLFQMHLLIENCCASIHLNCIRFAPTNNASTLVWTMACRQAGDNTVYGKWSLDSLRWNIKTSNKWMLVIICAKYVTNPYKIVDAVERTQ